MRAPSLLPSTGLRQVLRFFRRGLLMAVVIGGAFALAQSLLPGHRFWTTLAYSMSISFACWFFIDGGRLLAARWAHRKAAGPPDGQASQWPGWGWMSLVLPLGTLAGYGTGNEFAARLLGHEGAHVPGLDLRSIALILVVSMTPGIAATYFYYTRGRLAASRAQAEQAQRLAAEQRLMLLSSQLEPHMLFNTLANLRALIGVDPPRAQAMLDRLILFLRATLDASRASTHPLDHEFARLADYLELMQVRMGTRLQSRLTLPDELAAWPVPTLLLQPLVENANKHGLDPHVLGGRIDISAERQGSQVVLRVRDTGAGLHSVNPSRRDGFGLEQVRERISALYGAAASLELAPAPDGEGGALATLRLPA